MTFDVLLGSKEIDALLRRCQEPREPGELGQDFLKGYEVPALLASNSLGKPGFGEEPRPLVGRDRHAWGSLPARAPTRRPEPVDPVEDLERMLAQLASGDLGHARFSPFASLDAAGARSAALESRARRARGELRGPLDGLTIAVKDELDQRGLPTRGGRSLPLRAASRDAFLVGRLRASGALLPGKTHTTEWGMDAIGRNSGVDMPRNPLAPDRAAGGSSTGSAVAVAMGLCPLAIASDGGGSARIPASLCGILGLKCTPGLLSRSSDIFGGGTLHALGVMARRAQLIADFLEVAAGGSQGGESLDPQDPTTRWCPDRDRCAADRAASLERGVSGCVIGLPPSVWSSIHADRAAPGLRALEILASRGAILKEMEIPALRHAHAAGFIIIATESSTALRDVVLQHSRTPSLSPELLLLLNLARAVRVEEYGMALRARTTLRHQLARAFAQVDLIALPSVAIETPSYPASQDRSPVFADAEARGLCAFTFPANLAGLPALSLPIGSVSGLPSGLQLMADAWDEASLLSVASAWESFS